MPRLFFAAQRNSGAYHAHNNKSALSIETLIDFDFHQG
jgi:hypothetical protein